MNYSFKAKYEIHVNDSQLFNFIYKQTRTDLMDHFQNNENQVHVDNEGRVKMFYVLAHNHAPGEHHDHGAPEHFNEAEEDIDENAYEL